MDLTRTYVKGRPNTVIALMYKAVVKAQKKTIEAIKPGTKTSLLYKICAKSLLEDGFDIGERGFTHSAGHGIGAEVHERPALSPNSQDKLEIGNVVTVEPGLYYPGIGGVRIEDMVAVTKKGAENLVNYKKKLVIE